ncbi:hypothetical protein PHMEG_00010815 [Phytophthora megakarya]|uniref:Uncharacterized protein n=1 Tax=Phytophthora megakarya TaxID=4795 RepID=A0A225WCS0_9STRA|nr:hypothetical protein PHMEG_00010815 [Phytophthora megakarya]
MDKGVFMLDVPAQASVGGAVKPERLTEDRVSDTPQPVTDVETLDETITIKEEDSLSTVHEEAALKEKFSDFECGFWIARDPGEQGPGEGIRRGLSETMGVRTTRTSVATPREIHLTKRWSGLRAMVGYHDRDFMLPGRANDIGSSG